MLDCKYREVGKLKKRGKSLGEVVKGYLFFTSDSQNILICEVVQAAQSSMNLAKCFSFPGRLVAAVFVYLLPRMLWHVFSRCWIAGYDSVFWRNRK